MLILEHLLLGLSPRQFWLHIKEKKEENVFHSSKYSEVNRLVESFPVCSESVLVAQQLRHPSVNSRHTKLGLHDSKTEISQVAPTPSIHPSIQPTSPTIHLDLHLQQCGTCLHLLGGKSSELSSGIPLFKNITGWKSKMKHTTTCLDRPSMQHSWSFCCCIQAIKMTWSVGIIRPGMNWETGSLPSQLWFAETFSSPFRWCETNRSEHLVKTELQTCQPLCVLHRRSASEYANVMTKTHQKGCFLFPQAKKKSQKNQSTC